MKDNKLIYIAITLFLIIISIFYIKNNYNNIINYIITKYSNKADTVWVNDTVYKDTTITIKKDSFIPKYIFVIKTDTFYTKEGKDSIFKTESKLFKDTLICEKDSIILLSYITGQNASLDSIKADWKKSEKIITNTVTITKYIEKPKTMWNRIHIQPQITSGYDLINNKCGITCGIGVGIDLK